MWSELFFPDNLNNCESVSPYDEAETLVIQHDFTHLSFFRDDFREFVDTLVAALRIIEKSKGPMSNIHPAVVHASNLSEHRTLAIVALRQTVAVWW
jgi:hypothetical protein